MSTAVAIPARLRSSRLARKVLCDIGGRSLLERTHQVAVDADCGPVTVLTDAEEVAAEARRFGAAVLLTDERLDSGTARIASVVDRLGADVIVNLQADAPLTDPAVVARAAEECERGAALVTMPVHRIEDAGELHDPGVVKVVRARGGRALYCSRSAIPHVRGVDPAGWAETGEFWAHAGIYAYRREFLMAFGALPASGLEQAERLEQLRWLDDGLHIHTFEVDPQGPSVDTPDDLERVRSMVATGVAG
jgi:3-deoxy-manno-octulosonate cytidylyltransferase (CMP-KDO synthetase)